MRNLVGSMSRIAVREQPIPHLVSRYCEWRANFQLNKFSYLPLGGETLTFELVAPAFQYCSVRVNVKRRGFNLAHFGAQLQQALPQSPRK